MAVAVLQADERDSLRAQRDLVVRELRRRDGAVDQDPRVRAQLGRQGRAVLDSARLLRPAQQAARAPPPATHRQELGARDRQQLPQPPHRAHRTQR